MGIKDKLLNLIKQAKTNNTVNGIEIGVVNSPFAKIIEEQTNLNVEGYVITTDGYGMLHALKRHGNEPNENQVSLSEEDFSLIEQIVFEADKIEDVSHYEKNALQFSKLIDNEYFTIFEVITIIGEKKKLYKKTALPSKLCLLVRKVSKQ